MMKLSQLLQDVAIRESNADLEMEITGVSYDSRRTQAGDLFVAMAGYETDGHRFIPMAVEKGAAAVVYEDEAALTAQIPSWWPRRRCRCRW